MPNTPRTGDAEPVEVRIGPVGGLQRYVLGARRFDRNVKLFLTITAFRGMVIAAIATIFNLYLYSLGYDARFIGLINGVNSLAVLTISVPLGFLADRFGRRPVLLAGGLVYPLAIFALALSSSTTTVVLFSFTFGATATAYWVAGIPLLVASTTERERVQAFSLNSFLLWGLGPIASFASGQVVEMAARLLHVAPSSTAALRAGMLFMAALALLGSLPYPFLREPHVPEHVRVAQQRGGRMAKLFLKLLIPDVILSFGLGAILTFMQLYFHLRFRLDPGPIGLVLALGGIISGAGMLATPAIARRWGNLHAAVRFQWLVAPAAVVLALAGQLALAIPAFWVLLTLRGMSDPVYTAFVQEQVPEGYRARISGLYNVTYSIGYSLGPAASGQLQDLAGFTPAFLMGAGCYLVGATLLYLFFAREHPRRGRLVDTGAA